MINLFKKDITKVVIWELVGLITNSTLTWIKKKNQSELNLVFKLT